MKHQWKLTDEAKAQIPAWNAKWIGIIRRTTPMTAHERAKVAEALRAMYRLARLDGDGLRVVFVPSPLMAAVVAGAAAAWWWQNENAKSHAVTRAVTDAATRDATRAATRAATGDATYDATGDATYAVTDDATYAVTDDATYAATGDATRAVTGDATYDATRAATRAATDAATYAATYDATDAVTYAVTGDVTRDATRAATGAATYAATRAATGDATRAATRAATGDATRAATGDATRAATYDATYAATRDATRAVTDAATDDAHFATILYSALRVVGDSALARNCISQSWNMRNGGNQWAYWTCFLSFVRDVVGWTHPIHEAYSHYETCAISAGPRYMHPKFVVVSDMPTVLEGYDRDGQIVAHCDTGPALAWADGWKLWYLDGVKVDEQIVMRPESQTIQQIKDDANEEVRRVRIERFGWERFLRESKAQQINRRFNDRDGQWEQLYRLDDGTQRIVLVDPSTARRYALGVPREITTCEQAQDWMSCGLDRLAIHRS